MSFLILKKLTNLVPDIYAIYFRPRIFKVYITFQGNGLLKPLKNNLHIFFQHKIVLTYFKQRFVSISMADLTPVAWSHCTSI